MEKWTNSALACLEQCGEKFRRKYIEKEYVPPSARQVRGTVVHRSVRASMLRKMKEHDLPTVEEVRDLAATQFREEWLRGVQTTADEIQEAGSLQKIQDRAKDMAISLSVLHRTDVAPAITPVGVEQRVNVPASQLGVEVEGTLDLVDARPEGDWIRDTKTAEKSPNRDAAEKSQQFTMYGLLELVRTKKLPAGYRQDVLVRTPGRGDLKYVPLDTTRDMDDMHMMVARIRRATEAVQRGVFVPANPESWWCSKNWCEFFESCPFVRRGNGRPQS